MNLLFFTENEHFAHQQVNLRFVESRPISEAFNRQLEHVIWDAASFKAEDFAVFELEEIFTYLKATHRHYTNACIPKIENTLAQLYAKSTATNRAVVKWLIQRIHAYKKELIAHIEQEEEVVFKFVAQLLSTERDAYGADFAFHHFIQTHDDHILLQLDELKKTVEACDHQLRGDLVCAILFHQLTIFQKDITVHSLIEDQVFVPKIHAKMTAAKS